MPATVTSFLQLDSPVAETEETFIITGAGGVTSFVVTPTTIKLIDSLYITPTNAAAAGATYVSAGGNGATTVTITCPASSNYLVTLRGRRA